MTGLPGVAEAGGPAATPRGPGSDAAVARVRLGAPVTVRVPATSANLGPGFDCLALALGLYDHVTVEALDPAVTGPRVGVEVVGEGAGAVPDDDTHRVVAAVRAGLAHAGVEQPALRVRCRNEVPHGRGLGSSAAAVVAGLIAARGLLTTPGLLGDDAVLALATAAEGHHDNAAAALHGGLVLSWRDVAHLPATAVGADGSDGSDGSEAAQAGGAGETAGEVEAADRAGDRAAADAVGDAGPTRGPVRYARLPVDPRLRLVVCVPQERLATHTARALLPATVPHPDAAFTAARAALLVEALGRRPEPDLLLDATADRLHQARPCGRRATAGIVNVISTSVKIPLAAWA